MWGNFFFMAIGAFSLGFAEDGDLEDKGRDLYISSKTRKYSAECMIFDLDREDDQKREDIGIGEEAD